MSKSQSDSSQQSSTSTANYDQRIANESGIVVGQGATYTVNFPAQAVDVIGKVLDFTGGVVKAAGSFVDEAQMSQSAVNQGLIQSNREIQSQAQLGNASLLKDLLPVLTIGAVGLVIFLGFRRGR